MRLGVLVGMLGAGLVHAQDAAAPPPAAAATATPAKPSKTALEEGDALMADKQYSQALSRYIAAWLDNPNNPVVPTRVGQVFQALGKLAKSAEFYALAIRLKPDYEEPVVLLAQVYQKAKRPDQAQILLEEPSRQKLFGKSPRFQRELAVVYNRMNKPEKALALLNAAKATAPGQVNLYSEFGYAYFLQKKYPESAAAYAVAVEKNPHDAMSVLNRSYALEKAGKFPDAAAALTQYLELVKAKETDPQRKRLAELQAKK
jgi:tetratricopeptide (TPR) repeat protein